MSSEVIVPVVLANVFGAIIVGAVYWKTKAAEHRNYDSGLPQVHGIKTNKRLKQDVDSSFVIPLNHQTKTTNSPSVNAKRSNNVRKNSEIQKTAGKEEDYGDKLITDTDVGAEKKSDQPATTTDTDIGEEKKNDEPATSTATDTDDEKKENDKPSAKEETQGYTRNKRGLIIQPVAYNSETMFIDGPNSEEQERDLLFEKCTDFSSFTRKSIKPVNRNLSKTDRRNPFFIDGDSNSSMKDLLRLFHPRPILSKSWFLDNWTIHIVSTTMQHCDVKDLTTKEERYRVIYDIFLRNYWMPFFTLGKEPVKHESFPFIYSINNTVIYPRPQEVKELVLKNKHTDLPTNGIRLHDILRDIRRISENAEIYGHDLAYDDHGQKESYIRTEFWRIILAWEICFRPTLVMMMEGTDDEDNTWVRSWQIVKMIWDHAAEEEDAILVEIFCQVYTVQCISFQRELFLWYWMVGRWDELEELGLNKTNVTMHVYCLGEVFMFWFNGLVSNIQKLLPSHVGIDSLLGGRREREHSIVAPYSYISRMMNRFINVMYPYTVQENDQDTQM